MIYPVDEAFRLHGVAMALHQNGRAREALAPCRLALSVLERECGPSHPDVACVLLALGALHEELGEYAEAEREFHRADDMLEGYARERDPALVRLRVQARGRRAGIVRLLGRYEQAELFYLQSAELADRELGHHDEVLAAVLNGLGLVYKAVGRFADAERVYRRALAMATSPFDQADSEHNLGDLEGARGRFDAGLAHARRAVEIRTAALGVEHVAVARDVAGLASLLMGAGRMDEAEARYRQAVAVFEEVLGADHLDVAVTWEHLGDVASGAEAEARYRRALAGKEAALGTESPEVAATVRKLGLLLSGQGRTDEAMVLLYRAHDLLEEGLGPSHPQTLAAADDIAALAELGPGVDGPI
jgi:tetratricopeptide (TPR) repeat protein